MVKRSSTYLHFQQEYEDDSSIKLDLHHLVTSKKIYLAYKYNYLLLYTSFNKAPFSLLKFDLDVMFTYFYVPQMPLQSPKELCYNHRLLEVKNNMVYLKKLTKTCYKQAVVAMVRMLIIFIVFMSVSVARSTNHVIDCCIVGERQMRVFHTKSHRTNILLLREYKYTWLEE